MANTVTGVVKSRHLTLTAGQVDSITFATNFGWVEVTNRATSGGGITFTADSAAAAPTALAADTEWVGPGAALIVKLEGSSDQVRLISDTADAYSVRGVEG